MRLGSRGVRFGVFLTAMVLVTTGCQLWAFGRNTSGELGDGTLNGSFTPIDNSQVDFADVNGGGFH
ncbi:MAG: hypothetical protein OEW42_13080, partial [Acidimicrobiia bacterium]|nr:hypothetical protein [Acidimicrobiia bacterium]